MVLRYFVTGLILCFQLGNSTPIAKTADGKSPFLEQYIYRIDRIPRRHGGFIPYDQGSFLCVSQWL